MSLFGNSLQALAGRLGRVTSGSTRFIPQLDGLRFFAIFFVVVAHTFELFREHRSVPDTALVESLWFKATADIGVPGVKLFFAISGFILALPFLESRLKQGRPVKLGKYFLRRVTRLEPPYLVAMTLWFLIHWLIKHRSLAELTPHYLSSLTYSHMFVYGAPSTLLWAAWSLEIEVQFYLLAPAIFWLLCRPKRWQRWVAAGVLYGAAVWGAQLAGQDSLLVQMTLLGQLPYFLVGFVLAEAWVEQARDSAPYAAWDWVATAGWIGIITQFVWLPAGFLAGQLVFSALVGVTYYASLNGAIWAKLLSKQWLVVIGGMCYSIYLFHRVILSVVSERILLPRLSTGVGGIDLALLLFLTLVVVLLACGVVFALLERPCMNPNWPSELASRIRRGIRFRGQPE